MIGSYAFQYWMNENLLDYFPNIHDLLIALIRIIPTPFELVWYRKFLLLFKNCCDFFQRDALMHSRNSFCLSCKSLIYSSLKQLFEIFTWLLSTGMIMRIYRIKLFLIFLKFFLDLWLSDCKSDEKGTGRKVSSIFAFVIPKGLHFPLTPNSETNKSRNFIPVFCLHPFVLK